MRISGYRYAVIEENLRKSFPEKSDHEIKKIKLAFLRNLADVLVETLKSLTVSEKAIRKRVKIINPELVSDKVNSGKPVIVLASHQCNWEWQLLASCLLGFPIDAAYKEVRNKPINKMLLDMRSKFGALLIESKQFLRTAIKRKNVARGIAMVGDQRPPSNSEFRTSFLHQDTAMFTGGEKLAKAMNYEVMFMEMTRIKRGNYQIRLHELAAPPYDKNTFDITEKYALKMEDMIQKHPSDWLWSHKRWKY